jgi:hypothetical protein
MSPNQFDQGADVSFNRVERSYAKVGGHADAVDNVAQVLVGNRIVSADRAVIHAVSGEFARQLRPDKTGCAEDCNHADCGSGFLSR